MNSDSLAAGFFAGWYVSRHYLRSLRALWFSAGVAVGAGGVCVVFMLGAYR